MCSSAVAMLLLLLLLPSVLPSTPLHPSPSIRSPHYPPEEESQEFWKAGNQEALLREVQRQPIVKQAKNVILFLGDGMGVSTTTAARWASFSEREKEIYMYIFTMSFSGSFTLENPS